MKIFSYIIFSLYLLISLTGCSQTPSYDLSTVYGMNQKQVEAVYGSPASDGNTDDMSFYIRSWEMGDKSMMISFDRASGLPFQYVFSDYSGDGFTGTELEKEFQASETDSRYYVFFAKEPDTDKVRTMRVKPR